jgi:hypothetical protein
VGRDYPGPVADRLEWVLLAYRIPREPSTPRIGIWRKLRQLGAAQIVDGLVALPADARTKEQLEWVAERVHEAGGEAGVWVAQAASKKLERELAARMAAAAAEEYRVVIEDARAAAAEDDVTRRRTLGRLRRELARISRRDHFPPPERELARAAVEQLARSCEVVA